MANPSPIIVIPTILVLAFLWQTVLNRGIDYQCANCGEEFSISPLTGVLAPHNMMRKLLKCPSCGKRTWARPVRKEQ